MQFLTALATRPAIIADGFSRVGCVIDESPAGVRIPYDDGNMRRPRMCAEPPL